MRVRLPRVDNCDLNLFEFDYDLTMMVFFMDANERIYARYGGRDAENADNRQSLEGLRQTMLSVVQTHKTEKNRIAPKTTGGPKFIREGNQMGGGRCMHCHDIKEELNRQLVAQGDWDRDQVWRYPLPENVGFRLFVDKPNTVERVTPGSPAEKAGLEPGDRIRQMGAIPIHSFADAQTALDRAPISGSLPIVYRRSGKDQKSTLELVDGWRKTDLTWRTSMRRMIPRFSLPGKDLTSDEKKALGLPSNVLAYRLADTVSQRLKDLGFEPKDLVLGIEGKPLHLSASEFVGFVEREYLVGDSVRILVNRNGRSVVVPMALANR